MVKTLALSVAPQKADGGKSKVSPSSSGSMATERRDGSGDKTPSKGERAGTAAPVEPLPSSGETRRASQSKSKAKSLDSKPSKSSAGEEMPVLSNDVLGEAEDASTANLYGQVSLVL